MIRSDRGMWHPPRPGRRHPAQANPLGPHPATLLRPLALREPVSTFTAANLRAALFDPHLEQVGVTPSE
jgi:hypothetical protein